MNTPFRAKKWAARSIVVVVLLSALLTSINWIADRKRALEAFEQQYPSGSGAVWTVHDEETEILPRSLIERYSPFTQIVQLQVRHGHVDEERMATILRHFRKIEVLSTDQIPDSVDFIGILESLGGKPSLTRLHIFNVPLDDRVLPVLARCRSLTELSIVPSNFTGEDFPVLPEIQDIDLLSSEVNDAGFARIIASPKLQGIRVGSESLTKQGILNALTTAAPTVRALRVLNTKFPIEEMEAIEAEARKIAPEIDFAVYR